METLLKAILLGFCIIWASIQAGAMSPPGIVYDPKDLNVTLDIQDFKVSKNYIVRFNWKDSEIIAVNVDAEPNKIIQFVNTLNAYLSFYSGREKSIFIRESVINSIKIFNNSKWLKLTGGAPYYASLTELSMVFGIYCDETLRTYQQTCNRLYDHSFFYTDKNNIQIIALDNGILIIVDKAEVILNINSGQIPRVVWALKNKVEMIDGTKNDIMVQIRDYNDPHEIVTHLVKSIRKRTLQYEHDVN